MMTLREAQEHIARTCGPGWLPLVEQVFSSLPTGCTVDSVYEKWGALRFDVSHSSESLESLLEHIEDLSARTCQICGAPGDEVIVGGWVETLCARPSCRTSAEALEF